MPQLRSAPSALLILLLLGAGAAQAEDPVNSALQAQGAAIYADLCAGCHGDDAQGGNGPDITRTPRMFVAEAVRGVDQMPEVDLAESEIDAVAAYLARLP